jgi:hypothetical protein
VVSEVVEMDGRQVGVDEVVGELLAARETIKELRSEARSAVRRQRLEQELEPYQVELLKLQRHLEAHRTGG